MSEIVERWLKLAESADADARQEAARELRRFLPSAPVLNTLAILLGDNDWRVRRASVESFAACHFREICGPIFQALYEEDNPGRRNAAIDVLRQAGKQAVPFIGAHLRAGNKDVRMFLISILGDLRDDTHLTAIHDAVREGDPNLSSAALLALGKIAAPASRQILLETLETADPWLKFQAIEAAGEMRDPDAIDKLINYLEIPLYRKIALRALGKFHHPKAYRSIIRAIISDEEGSLEILASLVDMYDSVPPSILANQERRQIRTEWQQIMTDAALRKLEDRISKLEPDHKEKLLKVLTWNDRKTGTTFETNHELSDRTF